ncbi:MAG: HNH endonuclease [Bacteroidales bacterium]|nr:HNH endonuclease [Bacteroidales bacterium]
MATELTKEQFIEILLDEKITKPENIFDFQTIYSFDNHQAPANRVVRKQWKHSERLLVDKEGPRPVGPINSRIGWLGKRIAKKYPITLSKRENGTYRYWDLFFNGWNEGNLFIWQLKSNLIKALEETGLVEKKNAHKTIDQINKEFEEKVKFSKNDSEQERQERLKLANKRPISTSAQVNVFLRNPDVKVEILRRANEHCEYCQSPAPFKKDGDGEGFLEVHHIIPLAEDGDDTVENAVALCPNCHRHAHYGKNSFDVERLKAI